MRSCLIGLSVVVILTVVWTPSSSSQTCGGVVNGTQKEGEITSPTFPSPNITCTWYLIKTDMPYAIITVKDLKLQGYKASLVIYSGNATADGAKAELVGNFSQNSEVRPMVMSDNVTTIVLFTGDWPLNNGTAAFSLHYRIANDCRTERTILSTRIQSPLFSSGCLPLTCSYSLDGRNSEKNFTLSFSEFEMPKGRVTVKNENNTLAILSGSSIPKDIFTKGDNLLIEFTTNSTDNEGFTAVVNTIEPDCLLNISLTDLGRPVRLTLPSGVESPMSCQYVIASPENSTVLVSTNQKSLLTARVVVSDGWSLFGGQRRGNLGSKDNGLSFVSTGPVLSLYLSLDPSLSLTQDPVLISATAQAYGGVFTNNGSLEGRGGKSPESSPTLYYLTVPEHQKVRFEITDSLLFPASSIRCYDGLTELNPLLTEFRSDIPLYPVVSTGSQMLVVASDLSYRGFFTAEFSGITEDCDTVSSGAQGQYERQVTPGTEVKVCSWVIRPLNEDGVFLLRSSVSGFESGDNLTVFDGQSDYSQNVLRVSGHEPSQFVSLPVVASSARNGARLQFNLAAMNESKNSTASSRIVKADYSFSPGRFCGGSIDPDSEGNLLSPFFPNERYPLNLRCVWNSSVPENKTFYMTFDTFDLDSQHSISVLEYVNETEELGDNCTKSFNGSVVPSDVLLRGPYVNIIFSSEKSHQGGNSGSGFNITYRTIEFGDILTNNTGTISTPDFPRSVSATIECIWIISLPFKAKSSGDVPIAKFDLDLENYSQMSSNNVLEFRDGNSQNAPLSDLKPANGKTTGLYSRTNQLWVRYMYKLHDQPSNSPGFAFRLQYTTYECPKTQQCDNGVCMQASWKCNGIDECGDDTDEKNCINKSKGVAGFVVAILVIMGFCLGVLAALIAPSVYKRIRYPNYRHLREAVSPIDT